MTYEDYLKHYSKCHSRKCYFNCG